MASISRDKAGNRRILFPGPGGARRTIYLGRLPKRDAEEILRRVEALVVAKFSGRPVEVETAAWVAGLPAALAEKLARVGLIDPPEARAAASLGAFLRTYIDGRRDVKASSKLVWGHVERNLISFFGADRDLQTITPGDGDNFKQHLIGEGLAPTTVHKRLQFARSFFRAMVRQRAISENPFAEVSHAATGLADRQRFVARDEIAKVLEQCPDHHWRTMVALCRFGGLRCPSEVLSLRWSDVDWERSRLTVTSPKTEHHAGKECRVVPIFPELLEPLQTAFDRAPEGAVYVVDERFRKALGAGGWANCNLRTTLEKIIRRAGLEPWPRLWHNLRASRETELVERFPVQVVTSWLGNTPSIALKHYLMTTEEHFAAATKTGAEQATQNPTRNPTQYTALYSGIEPQAETAAHKKTPVFQGFPAPCEMVHACTVEDRGLEPLTFWLPARRSPN